MQFRPDPFLSVSIFFLSPGLSLSLSLSVPAWSWAGGMSVMHTLAGRMHSCRAQHPVPFVSTSSTSLKLCGTYAAPGSTPPSSFIPFFWASSIFQNLPLLQSGKCYQGACHNQQPCPTMNHVLMTMHRQGCLFLNIILWYFFPLSLHLACLELQT